MVQYQRKLRPCLRQERHYDQWLFRLASVYNWAVRKIELNQAQRGNSRKLAARQQARMANRKKDRNHTLTQRLVAENVVIAWSKDHIKGIANKGAANKGVADKFGKSVASSSHAQIRSMLAYKSPPSGTQFIEVASRNSTRTCSECGSLSGSTGLAGLSVRRWNCRCGAGHDRDVNAAVDTLIAAAGYAVEVAYA